MVKPKRTDNEFLPLLGHILTSDFSICPWMQYAFRELGVTAGKGTKNNPEVVKYLKIVGKSDDSTAWCSAFVNWCMEQAGYRGTRKATARSWLHWGVPIADYRFGAVAVFERGEAWQGHVAFLVRQEGANVWVLGGNQSNQVNIKKRPIKKEGGKLLGLRWPPAMGGAGFIMMPAE
jgi:uncharacterized protein (TIGR02594 family)